MIWPSFAARSSRPYDKKKNFYYTHSLFDSTSAVCEIKGFINKENNDFTLDVPARPGVEETKKKCRAANGDARRRAYIAKAGAAP